MSSPASSRRTARSISSASTNSSRASDSDLEHGSRIQSQGRRSASGSVNRKGTPSQSRTQDPGPIVRKREFKARHINMMSFGIRSLMVDTDYRGYYRNWPSISVRECFSFRGPNPICSCVSSDGDCLLFSIGTSQIDCTSGLK